MPDRDVVSDKDGRSSSRGHAAADDADGGGSEQKRQVAYGGDLIEEKEEAFLPLFQDDAADRLHPALVGAEALMLQPEIFHGVAHSQLFGQQGEQTIIPLFHRDILSDSRQVQ